MQTLYQKKPANSQTQANANPFARALAETEKLQSEAPSADNALNGPLAETMAQAGGQFPGGQMDQQTREQMLAEQAAEARRNELRRKRTLELNQIDSTDIFNRRELEVQEEIKKLREELKALAMEVAAFDKQVELTLMTNVVDPGQDGKYYINFFQKLRAFIMLLRQKVKSAKTWATQMNGKSAKRRKRSKQPGLDFGGTFNEKASTIQDMMHHERSNAYSGA